MKDSDIINLEKAINNLISQKDQLTEQKRDIELRLSVLNSEVSGRRLSTAKYADIIKKQNRLKYDRILVDDAISKLKSEIRKKDTLKFEIKKELKKSDNLDVKQNLTDLRNEYMAFASDTSRIASMRSMASQFAEKLQELINKL